MDCAVAVNNSLRDLHEEVDYYGKLCLFTHLSSITCCVLALHDCKMVGRTDFLLDLHLCQVLSQASGEDMII